jgi:hypothetical protein
MRSNAKKTFYYHADASSLGGFIDKPFQEAIPSQASVSLPSVGGHATTRTEAFNFKEIISCRAAYTRVSGRQIAENGPWSMTATAVVEGLKILEVFTAERIVAQVSVEYPGDGSYLRVSLAGSSFEGLRLGGCDATPTLSSKLLCGARTPITYPVFSQTGQEQADRIISSIEADRSGDDFQWLAERFGWMASDRKPEEDRCVLCSLVDGVKGPIPGASFGHVVEIPDFGRISLGELLVCPSSVQVFSFRFELGCGTGGHGSGPSANVQGGTSPP